MPAVRSIGARWCSEPQATRLRGPKVPGCGADESGLDPLHGSTRLERESVPARPCAGDAQHAGMGAQSRARVGLRRPSEGTRLNPNSCQLPTVSANALRPVRNRPAGSAFILVVSLDSRLPTPNRRHDEPDVRRSLLVRNKSETARHGSPRPRSLSVPQLRHAPGGARRSERPSTMSGDRSVFCDPTRFSARCTEGATVARDARAGGCADESRWVVTQAKHRSSSSRPKRAEVRRCGTRRPRARLRASCG